MCPEVEVLRTFCSATSRAKALARLTRKYRTGRRTASDVCLALDALLAQNLDAAAGLLALECMKQVAPVPTTLWDWACRHADRLGVRELRFMVSLAHAPRYRKHLDTAKLTATPEGLAALLHEAPRTPWAHAVVRGYFDACGEAKPPADGAAAM